ncbi:hypothetical protein CerSpe_172510 [Prunus speciosa]
MTPEYAIQGIVTSKVDVYSFGVVMLEIVSGKKNAGYKFNHESEHLLERTAYVAYKNGSLMDLVDKNLSGIYDEKQAITILTLVVMCTNISPTLRPRMADVVSILVGEKTFEHRSNQYSKSLPVHDSGGGGSSSSSSSHPPPLFIRRGLRIPRVLFN